MRGLGALPGLSFVSCGLNEGFAALVERRLSNGMKLVSQLNNTLVL